MRAGLFDDYPGFPGVRPDRNGRAICVARPTSLRWTSREHPRSSQLIASAEKKVISCLTVSGIRGQNVSGVVNYRALMKEWQAGDRQAGNRLFGELQRELDLIAAAKLAGEKNSSLSTGDLVNEAVIRLSRLKKIDLQDKAHILALASRVMRQVLVDHARKRDSGKRSHNKVTLVTNVGVWDRPIELLTLDWLLDELKEMDQERADIVEMRFFGGMSIADIALVLELSEATVKRRWVSTRAWLQDRLKE